MADSETMDESSTESLGEEQVDPEREGDAAPGEGQANEVQVADGGAQDAAEANGIVVTIGEEPPPQEEQTHAPEWVRELRKNYRELQREKRELEERLRCVVPAETKPAVLGVKPKLEDHDYDTDKYEAALAGWYERKREVDDLSAKAEAEAKSATAAWNEKLATYGKAKAELKVADFDDAEASVQGTLTQTQQGIILQGAENPALVVYALGKNHKKAKELALITDPVKYAFAVAKLETQLKVSQRKAPPPEGTVVRGTGSLSGAVDSTLERLRAEAAKTGDYTKVTQYKMQKRKAK